MKDENEDVMLLTSEYIITDKDGTLDKITREANNLYNASLYQVRQQFFKHNNFINNHWLDKCFKKKAQERENMLYRKMGICSNCTTNIARSE